MTTQGPELNKTYFEHNFSTLKEPRRTTKGNLLYPLEEILFLTISAVICGYTAWTSIEEFGKLKLPWLRKFYPYKNGIPSHDAISDLFSILDPKEFGSCFMSWIQNISDITDSEVVALDGKTIRGVGSSSRKYPIHIVSAFCTKNSICLAQQTVNDKSNEIIAIPQLLDLIAIKGCIVTIDAMGCQKEIAKKVRSKGADYILQVKDNQKELKEQIEKIFNRNTARTLDVQHDIGHGRAETRECTLINDLTFLDGKEPWKDIKGIARIKSTRYIKKTGAESHYFRYYITSLSSDAEKVNKSIRSHWAIENNLHWNLDVIFKEDGQLKRKGNSAENFNIISKVALGLIVNEDTPKKTKPLKMLKASLDDSYREKIMKL